MNIAYITTRFPELTETFVAREITEVVGQGQNVFICQLRPAWRNKQTLGLTVDDTTLIKWYWNIFSLIWANIHIAFRRPSAYRECIKDIIRSRGGGARTFRLIYMILVSAWIAKRLDCEDIDHIHCHFLYTGAVGAMWVARLMGKKYSVTAHTTVLYDSRSLAIRAVKDAAFLIADIKVVHEMLLELSGDDGCPVHFIRNGIKFDDLAKRTDRKTENDKIPVLLSIGKLWDKKGFDILIQACEILVKNNIAFKCRIVGNGQERPKLEKMCRDLRLEGKVTFVGALSFPELKLEYENADILVMPSKKTEQGSDGLPTVCIEALAMGIPTVATRWAGIPDLIIDHETGLLAEPNDVKSLADNLEELLRNRDLWDQFALNGRKVVEKEYDLIKNTSLLVSYWKKYLGVL